MTAWLYGIGAVILWCLVPVGVKGGVQDLDWSWLLIIRFTLSSILLAPFFVRAIPFWKKHKRLALMGTALLGLNYGLQTYAIIHLPVSLFTLIFGLSPLVCSLVSGTFYWSRLSIVGSLFSIAGAWFALGKVGEGNASFFSLFCLVGGLVAWAFVTRWMKVVQTQGLDALSLSSSLQPLSIIGVVPIWMMNGFHLEALKMKHFSSLLILSVGIPAAFFLYSKALRLTPRVGIASQYLEPVIGCIFGAVLYSEAIRPSKIIAMVLILLGLALQEFGSQHSPAKAKIIKNTLISRGFKSRFLYGN